MTSQPDHIAWRKCHKYKLRSLLFISVLQSLILNNFVIYGNRLRKLVTFEGGCLLMEVTSTSETSANFYQTTRRNIPEDSHLHTRYCENLKYHLVSFVVTKNAILIKSNNK
jgi:hypothetical protein